MFKNLSITQSKRIVYYIIYDVIYRFKLFNEYFSTQYICTLQADSNRHGDQQKKLSSVFKIRLISNCLLILLHQYKDVGEIDPRFFLLYRNSKVRRTQNEYTYKNAIFKLVDRIQKNRPFICLFICFNGNHVNCKSLFH